MTGHGAQPIKRDVAFFRALHQLFGDVLAAFMVAAVWQILANLFEHDVHVGGSAFIELDHFTPGYSRGDVLPIPIYRRKSQPPTFDFLAKPVGVLLNAIAGKTIMATGALIEFDLLPNVLIKYEQTFVLRL